MIREIAFQENHGMELAGEEFTRMPALSVPGDLLPLYLKKNLGFVMKRDLDVGLLGREIAMELASCFGRLGSMYYFLQDITGQR